MKTVDHNEIFYKSLSNITGLDIETIRVYANDNQVLNIIERPDIINPNESQEKKLADLKQLISLFSLFKEQEKNRIMKLDGEKAAKKYFEGLLSYKKDKEQFIVSYLSNSYEIIETKIIAEGTLNRVLIPLREVLENALKNKATGIIMAHNHPSGSLTPSNEDIQLTQKIINIFHPLEIRVYDHIIVGNNTSLSLAKSGSVNFKEPTGIANYNPFILGKGEVQTEKTVKNAIEKMMETDYGTFLKGMVSAETGITDETVLDKLYEKYTNDIIEKQNGSILNKELVKLAMQMEKISQTIYIVSDEKERKAYMLFAKENNMEDIEVVTKDSLSGKNFNKYKNAIIALKKNDDYETVRRELKHLQPNLKTRKHQPVEKSFEEDWQKKTMLNAHNQEEVEITISE